MNDVIYKYPLRPHSVFIDVPLGAKLLAVGAQDDDVVAWYRVNPNLGKRPRVCAAFPTGVDLPAVCNHTEYVGTVQMRDGLVFHVFEGEAVEQDGVTTVAGMNGAAGVGG